MSFPLNMSKNVISCDGGDECKKQGHLRDHETKTCVHPGSVLGRLLALRLKTSGNPNSEISPIEIEENGAEISDQNDQVKKTQSPSHVTTTSVSKEESGKVTVIVNNHNTNNVDGGEVTHTGGLSSNLARQPHTQSYRSQPVNKLSNSQKQVTSFKSKSTKGIKGGVTRSEDENENEENDDDENDASFIPIIPKAIDADKLIAFQEKVDDLEKKFQGIQNQIMETATEAKIQESTARKIEDLKFKAQKKMDFYKSDLVVIENDLRAYVEASRNGERLEDERDFANKKMLYEETNQAIQRSQAAIEKISEEMQKEVEKNKRFVSKIKLLQTDATMTLIQLNSAKENLKDYKKMFKNTGSDVEEKSYELRGGLTKKEEVLKQFSKILQDNNIKPSGATRTKFYELMEKAKSSKHLNGMSVEQEFLKLNI
jgi:hypothetical protein